MTANCMFLGLAGVNPQEYFANQNEALNAKRNAKPSKRKLVTRLKIVWNSLPKTFKMTLLILPLLGLLCSIANAVVMGFYIGTSETKIRTNKPTNVSYDTRSLWNAFLYHHMDLAMIPIVLQVGCVIPTAFYIFSYGFSVAKSPIMSEYLDAYADKTAYLFGYTLLLLGTSVVAALDKHFLVVTLIIEIFIGFVRVFMTLHMRNAISVNDNKQPMTVMDSGESGDIPLCEPLFVQDTEREDNMG